VEWRWQFQVFMPQGMGSPWLPEPMTLHVVSDALIALAYFTIPFSILRFVRGRDDLDRSHLRLSFLFAAFIALCGVTHVMSIVVLWAPVHGIEGWIKAATAIVSLATAFWLFTFVPLALKLPSVRAMQREIAAHRTTMDALDAARAAIAVKFDSTTDELRAAEQELQRSAALLKTVVEVVPGLIYAKDRSGRMLLANKASLDLLGKPWAEVEGRTDIEVIADRRRAELVMANDRRVMTCGVTQVHEEVIDHPEHGPRVYLSTKVPVGETDKGPTCLVVLSIDITERKQLAVELLHVSRRTAMGDMATAIAHEINQPLAAIALYLEGSMAVLANERYEGPLLKTLTLAKDQCIRAGDIIRRVRSFVSGGDNVRRSENARLVVDEACRLALMGSHESGVTTSIEHEESEIFVLVDRVQVEQVIVNLVRNAMEAMGDTKGGTLRITTEYAMEGMAMVSVSDNGPGISAEVVGRLFDPFVSTKGVKGMGVGLSICRTIVEGQGGKIWADQHPVRGATFRFTLPLLGLGAGA
jgi:two-component system sensor kinase FixL